MEEKNLNLPKEIAERLDVAMKSGKYFICITCDVGGPKNMQHFWSTKSFPKDRLIPTLEYFKDDLASRELRGNVGKWE